MASRVLLFALALALARCRTEPATKAPPPPPPPTPREILLDELAYYDEVAEKRPDLLAQDCYDTLTIKPKYRAAILRDHDGVPAIRARVYSADLQARDAAWASALRSYEIAFCAEHDHSQGCADVCKKACAACPGPLATSPFVREPIEPTGYSLCDFVGYRVGDAHRPSGKIRDWKVFFELGDDFAAVLTPRAYFEFTEALARAGFRGDSKISMGAGRVRFQYNDIIVHAATPEDARTAERVGLHEFGGAIVSHARGLDLADEKNGVLDWHHYLCAEGKAGIPPEGLAFVRGN